MAMAPVLMKGKVFKISITNSPSNEYVKLSNELSDTNKHNSELEGKQQLALVDYGKLFAKYKEQENCVVMTTTARCRAARSKRRTYRNTELRRKLELAKNFVQTFNILGYKRKFELSSSNLSSSDFEEECLLAFAPF